MNDTSTEAQISAQVAGIHDAASEDRVVTILDDDVAICVLRQTLEATLEPAMRAAVERTTGRTVSTVGANVHLEPDLTMLTFTFASPQPRGRSSIVG